MATLTLNPDTIETVDPEQYPFVMAAEDAIIAATTATEVVAALPGMDPGYLSLDDDQALLARYEFALLAARDAQDRLAHDTDGVDVAGLPEDVLTLLFGVGKHVPLAGLETWNETVPLVLISTDYAPYTESLPPHGNVKFVNPADERSLLDTLVDLGLIDLVVGA